MTSAERQQLSTFLRAIKHDPDEDVNYRVLADWLQERGDPRGEWIALELELYRLEDSDPSREDLLRRYRLLTSQYQTRWMGPLLDLPIRWVFRRGFTYLDSYCSHLTTDEVSRMVEAGAFDFVLSLHLFDFRGTLASRFIDSRLMDVIPCLSLFDTRLTDRSLSILLSSPRIVALRELNVRYNQLTPSSAVAIAHCPHLVELRKLNVRQNQIGDEGAIALANSPWLNSLTELDVYQCGISSEGIAALYERFGEAVLAT